MAITDDRVAGRELLAATRPDLYGRTANALRGRDLLAATRPDLYGSPQVQQAYQNAPPPDAQIVRDDASQSSRALRQAFGQFGAGVRVLPSMIRHALGDQEGAQQGYDRFMQETQRLQERGPDIQQWSDVDSFGDALAFARNTALSAAPDILASVAGAGVASTLARRGMSRYLTTSMAGRVAERAARVPASPIGRRVTQERAKDTAIAATASVEATMGREAAQRVAQGIAARMPAVRSASRRGAWTGAAAGQYPGTAAQSVEVMQNATPGEARSVMATDLLASVVGAAPSVRLFGKLGDRASQEAVQQGTQRLLPRVLREFGVQGSQEATLGIAQAVTQLVGHRLVDDKIDLLGPAALERYLAEGVGGFILGGGLGAANAGLFGGRRPSARTDEDMQAIRARFQERLKSMWKNTRGRYRPGEEVPPDSQTGTQADDVAFDLEIAEDMAGIERRLDEAHDRYTRGEVDALAGIEAQVAPHELPEYARAWPPLKRALMQTLSKDSRAWQTQDRAETVAATLEQVFRGGEISESQSRILDALLDGDISRETLNHWRTMGPEYADMLDQINGREPRSTAPDTETADAETPVPETAMAEAFRNAQTATRATDVDAARGADEDAMYERFSSGDGDDVDTAAAIAEAYAGLDARDASGGGGGGSAGTRSGSDDFMPVTSPSDRMESLRQTGRSLRTQIAQNEDGKPTPDQQRQLDDAQKAYSEARNELRTEILGAPDARMTAGKNVLTPFINADGSHNVADLNRRLKEPRTVELADPVDFLFKRQVHKVRAGVDLSNVVVQRLSRYRGRYSNPKEALFEAIGDMALAGINIKPESFTAGPVYRRTKNSDGRIVNGEMLFELTDADVRFLRNDIKKREDATPETRDAVDQDVRRSMAAQREATDEDVAYGDVPGRVSEAANERRDDLKQQIAEGERTLADAKRRGDRETMREVGAEINQNKRLLKALDARDERPEHAQGESPVDFQIEDPSLRRQGERAPPPGSKDVDNQFISDVSPVSEADATNPHSSVVERARKQVANTKSGSPQRRAIMVGAGREIGRAELAKQLEAPNSNERRIRREMDRLERDEDMAVKYLRDAAAGKFNTVTVRHAQMDSNAPQVDAKGERTVSERLQHAANAILGRNKNQTVSDAQIVELIGDIGDMPPSRSSDNRSEATVTTTPGGQVKNVRRSARAALIHAAEMLADSLPSGHPIRRALDARMDRIGVLARGPGGHVARTPDGKVRLAGRAADDEASLALRSSQQQRNANERERIDAGKITPEQRAKARQKALDSAARGERPGDERGESAKSEDTEFIAEARASAARLTREADRAENASKSRRVPAPPPAKTTPRSETTTPTSGLAAARRAQVAASRQEARSTSQARKQAVRLRDRGGPEAFDQDLDSAGTGTETVMTVRAAIRSLFNTALDSVVVVRRTAKQLFDAAGIDPAKMPAGVLFSYSDTQKSADASVRDFATYINTKLDADGLPYISKETRTDDDVNAIATKFLDAVEKDPRLLINPVSSEKLSVSQYLVDEETGAAIDPNDPSQHWRLSDIGRHVASAITSGRISDILDAEATRITEGRDSALVDLIRVLDESGIGTPVERARVVIAASKYATSGTYSPTSGEVRVRADGIGDNRHGVTMNEAIAKEIVKELRAGKGMKAAMKAATATSVEAARRSNKHANTTGWVEFKKDSSPEALNKAMHGTGWCTGFTDISYAATQIREGSFWAYYENGEPQIGIRTEDGRLSPADPPRGRLEGQRLPPKYAKVAEDFLESGGKVTGGEQFIKERREKLAVRELLASEGMLSPEQFHNAVMVVVGKDGEVTFGVANGKAYNAEGVVFPASRIPPQFRGVVGAMENAAVVRFEGSSLPSEFRIIRGSLESDTLTSLSELREVGGNLYAPGLTSALKLERVGKDLYAPVLKSAQELREVGGDVGALNLTSVPKLERVGGNVYAPGLTSAPKLERVGGNLRADALTSAPELREVGGDLRADALTSAPKLERVGRSMHADALTSAPKLERVGRSMHADALTSAPKLERVGGSLSVGALTSAPELREVGGNVYAGALTSAPKLERVGGDLRADALTSAPELREVGMSFVARALASAPKLERVGRDMHAGALKSAPELREVGGALYGDALTHAPKLSVPLHELRNRGSYYLTRDDDIPFSLDASGKVQGFVYKNKAYLAAGNIERNQARGVLMHELGEHLGDLRGLLGDANYDKLFKTVEGWANSAGKEGEIAKAAIRRAKESGNYETELLAYAIEEAVNAGVKPTAEGVVGKWLKAVMNAFKAALKRLTGADVNLIAQDLVDLAHGAALRGSSTRTAKRRDRGGPEAFDQDLNFAGTLDSQPGGRHDIKHEESMLNAMLEKMGIKDKIVLKGVDSMSHNPRAVASYNVNTSTIRVRNDLTGPARLESLAHELGHHIILSEIARAMGVPVSKVPKGNRIGDLNSRMLLLKEHNPKLFNALSKDFQEWRDANSKPGRSTRDALAGKKGIHSWTERPNSKQIDELTDSQLAYLFDMEEWFADNIARALTTKPAGLSVVQQFFKDIADKIKDLFKQLKAAGQHRDWQPAPSVDRFVASLFARQTRAVNAALGRTVTPKQARVAAQASVVEAAAIPPTPPQGPPASPPPPPAPPTGPVPPTSFRQLVRYVRDVLLPEERSTMLRALSSSNAIRRLREVYAGDPAALRAMSSAKLGAEARIAFGYKAWKEGKIKFGPKAEGEANNISNNFHRIRRALKIVGDDAVTERIFADTADGTIQRMREANERYDAVELEKQATGRLQKIIDWAAPFYDGTRGVVRKVLQSKRDDINSWGIPAMTRIANALRTSVGVTGGQRGLELDVVHQTSVFLDRVSNIFAGLSEADAVKALTAMQSRQKDLSGLSEGVRKAVEGTRKFMDDAHRYMDKAGVKIAKRDLFFPVMMSLKDAQDEGRLTKLLSQPHFAEHIAKLYREGSGFGEAVKRSQGVDGTFATPEVAQESMQEYIADLVRGASDDSSEALMPKLSGAPNFKSANSRIMQFIYDHGTPEDIATFASLQLKSPAEVFSRYVEPMVKRAEYARRFGDDGAKLQRMLEQAKQQGATDEQVATVTAMVEASVGAYGADGSPVIRAISPKLADRLHNRSVQRGIQNIQAYQNWRNLPLAALASLADPMGIGVRAGGDFKVAWDGWKLGIKAIFDKQTRAEIDQMLRTLGAAADMGAISDIQAGFGGAGTPVARKANDFLFRVNGLSAVAKFSRYMALRSAHGFLLKHGGRANDTSVRYMDDMNIRAGDVQEGADGMVRILSPEERANASKEAVEADDRVRLALMQFVDEAILRPSSQQTPLWHSDPYMGLVTQYKAFAYAIYEQIGKRIVHEFKHGNLGVIAPAIAYLPIVMAAEMGREVIQYGPEGNPNRENWGPWEYTNLAVERSALLGPIPTFVDEAASDMKYGSMPGSSFLGPTATQARRVWDGRNWAQDFENAMPLSALWKHHVNPTQWTQG